MIFGDGEMSYKDIFPLAVTLIFLICVVVFIFIIYLWIKKGKEGYVEHKNVYVKMYDDEGYDRYGYTIDGIDRKGRYNRMRDRAAYKESRYSRDGFLNVTHYPLSISKHAKERMAERVHIVDGLGMKQQVHDAYSFGKSRRQIKKSSAAMLEDIETRNGKKRIALLYKGYIYLFSEKNVLITVYKNDHIPL